MREGVNPIKLSDLKNTLKPHRIVVVFYIPNSEEDYFKELDLVLDKCLESIINTINPNTTNITLINNNSSENVNIIVDKYSKHIDKYVLYNENKGKVYAVLNEVRAVYEPYVTITDADVLFYSGWEQAVFDVFNNVPNCGVVSPLPVPHCAFYNNEIVFLNLLNIYYNKFVDDEDLNLYASSISNNNIFNRRKQKSWTNKQFVIQKNKKNYLLGSTHFVATYKTEIFNLKKHNFPYEKFKNGYESEFIDVLAKNNGYYRLSTIKTFAYHIGNKINDEIVKNHIFDNSKIIKDNYQIKTYTKNSLFFFIKLKNLIGKILIKLYWNKL